jgi:hypothetical protein
LKELDYATSGADETVRTNEMLHWNLFLDDQFLRGKPWRKRMCPFEDLGKFSETMDWVRKIAVGKDCFDPQESPEPVAKVRAYEVISGSRNETTVGEGKEGEEGEGKEGEEGEEGQEEEQEDE